MARVFKQIGVPGKLQKVSPDTDFIFQRMPVKQRKLHEALVLMAFLDADF